MEDAIRSDKVKAEAVRFLWNGRVPIGMPTLVAGRPGEGKSLFAAYIAAEVTKKGGAVIFSNMEDPLPQVVRPRLEAAGAKLDKVFFWTPILPGDLEQLENLIKLTKAKLVVLDPIAAHLRVSIYNDQEIRRVLSPLSKLLAKHHAAALFIHHTVKGTGRGGHPLRAIGGSGGGMAGAPRAVYVFGHNPLNGDERVLVPIKFNIGPTPKPSYFEMDEEEVIAGTGMKAKLLQAGKLSHMPTRSEKVDAWTVILGDRVANSLGITVDRKAEAAEWLTHYLSDGPQPVKQLKEDALQNGLSWHTVRNAAEMVEIVITRVGFGVGGKSLWALPPGHPALKPLADGEEGNG
jgi:putative DNA primase/helicase